ncbi:hypothetical protein ACFFSH_38110 [Streptomyces filamentosus]|uniref:Secreted protein n=1 Tax=Streptomyces filamentosus TaxID=67294 RepID=A0A919BVF6_STRFL|nr:hypothetical protein [Streptomyces filamentosus]GHG15077.1 hypothetical protein GCM10017667_55710 [Streptomyces filamentosus]
MHIRPITTMASLLFAFTLTACGAADNPPATLSDKQGAEASTATPTATVDVEAAAQACSDAVYAVVKDTAATDAASLTKPPECATISDADYLETVLAVIQQQNKDGQDALRKAIEDAATPTP